MTQPTIDTLVWVRMQVDRITGTQLLAGANYHGRLLGIDPALLPLPTEENPGVLLGLPGYAVPAEPGDPVSYVWVMRTPLDPVTRDHIRDLPGPSGWVDPDLDLTRNVYRRWARRLINDIGMTPDSVRVMLTDLFEAAKIELT